MIHVTCMLTAKNRDQLRNPTLGNRVWAMIPLPLLEWQDLSGRHSGVRGANIAAQARSERRFTVASQFSPVQALLYTRRRRTESFATDAKK